jgi:sigma-B regulation protein RsbU (phosphoserine phosphatase)
MAPADEVGGDFYDVLRDESGQRLWLTVGDVSSHGLPSGLVMLMTQAAFASHFRAASSSSPDAVIRGVNELLCENLTERLKDDKYVTAEVLCYRGSGVFTCAGGHQWPLVYRARLGSCEIVEAPGPWLGIQRDLDDVPLTNIALEAGDVLCLYSDGIIEARNSVGELFDVSRLKAALESELRGAELAHIAEAVFARVQEYSSTRDDDWTLFLARYQPSSSH